MEQLKKIITIELADYGMDGQIIMRQPSLRKQNEFKNTMGKYMKFTQGSAPQMSDNVPLGDLEIAMLMQYIYQAPFRTTIEGFLSFTDDMDPAMAKELMARLNDALKEIDESSPFVSSPSAETESSE